MINEIRTTLSDVSLSKVSGKYLSDKSYGFDTTYFIAKFILHNAINRRFNKNALREKAINYIEDLFQLTKGTAGAVNYYVETVNLLTFGNVLTTDNKKDYFISQPEILKFIAQQPENAYVYLYLLAYMTIKNDSILPLVEKYTVSNDIEEQGYLINKIYEKFVEKSVSIEKSGTNWSKQLVKYTITVLGYANKMKYVTRTLNVKDKIVTIEDACLNIAGTRTPIYLPKKNDYLQHFNLNYVKYHLKGFLIRPESVFVSQIQTVDTVARNLADLKLAMLDDTIGDEQMTDVEKQQYLDDVVRTRNPAVQSQFRKGLFDNNEHVCPICGFSFEKFLIASHIRPYAKCEDTYDAINHYNGLLMCPNHDKLFEDARYMTIDYRTGEIKLSEEAKYSKDYGSLEGISIAKTYVNCERRHYLEWHNDRFLEHNK